MPEVPGPDDPKPLARSLGEFFGHIWKGVTTDPSKKTVRRERTEELERDTPAGRVKIRRTVIEEVELPPDGPGQS